MTKRLIRREKFEYARMLSRNVKTDGKSFFRYLKRKKVRCVGPLENENGELILDNKEMTDEMNKYFSSVFTMEDTKHSSDSCKSGNRGRQELNEIIEKELNFQLGHHSSVTGLKC